MVYFCWKSRTYSTSPASDVLGGVKKFNEESYQVDAQQVNGKWGYVGGLKVTYLNIHADLTNLFAFIKGIR